MAQGFVPLNPGAGPLQSAAWFEAANPNNFHQQIVLQTQTGTSDPVSVSVNSPLPIQGPAASLTAVSGFPVQVGAVFNSAAPAVANGQIVPLQTDSSGNLLVNIKAGAAAGGTSGSIGAANATVATPVSFSNGSTMQLGQVDGSGNLKVNIAAGGVPAGQDNSTFTAGTTNGLAAFGVYNDGIGALTSGNYGAVRLTSDRKIYAAVGAAVSGGWTAYKLTSAASTNANSLKASAGQIGTFSAYNSGAAVAYLKIYNKASAPTVGTDTPIQVHMIPAGGGTNPSLGGGLAFSTGIAFAITAGTGLDTDTNAVAAAQVQVNIGYQ